MDSWSILASNVAYLITQGIRDFYIMDHASRYDGRAYFEEVFGQDAAFHWFRKNTRPFFQAAMTTFLVEQAKAHDFDIALIFDADEFFVTRTPQASLTETISREIKGYDHLLVEAKNYVLPIRAKHFSIDSLTDSRIDSRSLDPVLFSLKKEKFHFQVKVKNLGKSVLNLTNWKPVNRVSTGNHYAFGRGRASADIQLIHLPFWSLGSIQQRQDHGTNLRLSGAESGIGDHNLSLAGVEHEETWKRNTWPSVPSISEAQEKLPSAETGLADLALSISRRYPSRAFTEAEILKSSAALADWHDVSGSIDSIGPLIYSKDSKSIFGLAKRAFRVFKRARFSLTIRGNQITG